jgi:putative ABC transport system permease protein
VTVLGLAWRGVLRRPLSTALTAFGVALGTALSLGVLALGDATRQSFRAPAAGYDVILGPTHGSALQAVLFTLYHVDQAAGTVPWSVYEEAKADPRVAVAVPYAVGDTFRGWRVVGTSPDLFHVLEDGDRRPLAEGVTGRLFHPGAFEAVVGSLAGRSAQLAVGDTFTVTHGESAGGTEHAEHWTVVGVLRPSGTPQDRGIFISIESFFDVEGHTDVKEGQGAIKALSSVGIRLKSAATRLQYFSEYRKDRTDVQPAMPSDEVRKLMNLVEPLETVFRLTALLVIVVAGVGILVGLYNTIQGRRREIAVLRALGARPAHVFAVIVLESLLICLLGGVAGLVLGHGGVALASPTILERFGVRAAVHPGPLDLAILGGLAVLGLVVGLLPAWRGLRTPVAASLHPTD